MGSSGIVVILWGAFLLVFGSVFVADAIAASLNSVPALVAVAWSVLPLAGALLAGLVLRTLAIGRAWVPMVGFALGDAGGYLRVARLLGWRTVRLTDGEPLSIEVVLQPVRSRWGLLHGSQLHVSLRVLAGGRALAFVGFSGVSADLDWPSWCAAQREVLPDVSVVLKDLRGN